MTSEIQDPAYRVSRLTPAKYKAHLKSSAKEREQLGMAHGTATWRLLRRVVFRLLQDVGRDDCFRCGLTMNAETWTVDHIQDWLDADSALFWDLENITYSHKSCNTRAARKPLSDSRMKDGLHWCSKHKGFLEQENFYQDPRSGTGFSYWCRECKKKTRAAIRGPFVAR